MSWIVSTNQGQKVPMADASGEKPALPESFVVLEGEFTVPMSVPHLESFELVIEPTLTGSPTGNEVANVQARPNRDADWYLLEAVDISASPAETIRKRYECPGSQVRVGVVDAESAVIYVQGLAANRT